MNRRLFLALIAAAFAAGPLAAQTGAEKLGWKLALQSWTMNYQTPSDTVAKPGKTVFDSIDMCKTLGLKYLEVYSNQELGGGDKGKFGPSMTDAQIQAVLERAKATGVSIIDCGVIGIPGKEEDARKTFAWAKKVGITTLVSEPKPADLPMIDKLAGEYGIPVALHDHPKPSVYWDPEYTTGVIRELKHVGLCADVGHWKRSGLEPAAVISKHGDKVFSSHFKDLVPGKDGKGWHDVPWGTGESKAAEMLKALKEHKFKGPIAIEFETKWDVPTLQKCVAFFNAEADKLAK